jgi:hypothetical protein
MLVAVACLAAPRDGEAQTPTPPPLPARPPGGRAGIAGPRLPLIAVVTNAPYTADVESTVTQVLADGTRIEQRATGRIYRDAAGRMRREQQVIGLGPLAASTDPITLVTITDPTTRSTYTINDDARTATKNPYSQVLQWNAPQGFVAITGGLVYAQPGPGSVPMPAPMMQGADQALNDLVPAAPLRVTQAGLQPLAPLPALAPDAGARGQGVRQGGPRNVRTESLGPRQMEGVNVAGMRITMTIPTGQIGNDRPIVITDETWQSPDLKTTVYSKHHDPRTGDVEFQLRNISRNEPPPQLFQVPAGYTVIDALGAAGVPGPRGGRAGRGLPPVPAPVPLPRPPAQ